MKVRLLDRDGRQVRAHETLGGMPCALFSGDRIYVAVAPGVLQEHGRGARFVGAALLEKVQ